MLLLGACGADDTSHAGGPSPAIQADGGAPAAVDAGGGPGPGRSDGGSGIVGGPTLDAAASSAAEAGSTADGQPRPSDASVAQADARPATASDAGAASDAGVDAGPQPAGSCGASARVNTPFGCKFAWGTNDPGTSLAGYERLGFITKWVGYEVDKSGNLPRCDGCSWLGTLAGKTSVPVYYAYFIGFLGSANGFADQNVNPNGPNLATDGAQLIRAQRSKIIDMYASYARQSAAVWKDKPVVWLLEGDFVQYTYAEQKQTLSMRELGELARDITCAIKSNMPNAVVAINHTTWLSDEVTNQFWDAMAGVAYDLVWTTGVANNMGFLEKNANASTYNHATATYAYVAKKTGRKILVDTSFGLSGMSDTWVSAGAAVLNQRIAEGVIAANVTMPAAGYVAATESLSSSLSMVCQ
jgi:hypothetical protein